MSNTSSALDGLTLLARGKVRDVYTIDDVRLLLVASDRISAFDCISPTPISGKGKILTQLSKFWFDKLQDITPHHLLTTKIDAMPSSVQRHKTALEHRSMLCVKTEVVPFECVVRGYLAGSGWKDYQASGEVCGHKLPKGLRDGDKLPEPIFTPATKAASGHDENISTEFMAQRIGSETTEHLKNTSLALYKTASEYARSCGIIIADTKFEFGIDKHGRTLLIDEVLTPDSSRFWDASRYEPGKPQASFDKQFVRDYYETLDWNKQPPAPELPLEIVTATTARYREAYRRLTNSEAEF